METAATAERQPTIVDNGQCTLSVWTENEGKFQLSEAAIAKLRTIKVVGLAFRNSDLVKGTDTREGHQTFPNFENTVLGYCPTIVLENGEAGLMIAKLAPARCQDGTFPPTDEYVNFVENMLNHLVTEFGGTIQQWDGISFNAGAIRQMELPYQYLSIELDPDATAFVWVGGSKSANLTDQDKANAAPLSKLAPVGTNKQGVIILL